MVFEMTRSFMWLLELGARDSFAPWPSLPVLWRLLEVVLGPDAAFAALWVALAAATMSLLLNTGW